MPSAVEVQSPNHWTAREVLLIVVLICISLMISDVDLSLCLLAICISYLKKYLFRSLPIFYIDCSFPIELYEFFIYFGY